MPREYKKAGIKNQWSQEQLEKAMAAVRGKELNTNQAAKCYRIPYSTLSDHLKDKSKKRYGGPPTVMTMDEEREIYRSCQVLQQFGFPLNVDTVGIIVRDYLNDIKRLNPFANSIPGRNWWEGFLRRWPELVKRKPQHLPKCRALGGRAEIIYSWFDKMKMFLEEVKIADASDLASRLWNADETGFSLAIASGQVLAKRGSRDVHETGGGTGREYVTVLGCGSADGSRISPYILYKGVHLYKRWTVDGLAGTLYSVSKSGWMEADNFIQWFLKLFVPSVNHLLSTGPVVLFVDGHQSHLSLQLIRIAKEKGIHLYCLPPHTTHILQPLDVGVYGPIKQAWKKIMKDHKTETLAANVTKEVFPGLIAKLWKCSFKSDHLKGGFRATGLYPVNREAIDTKKLLPSVPFESVSGPASVSISVPSTSSSETSLSSTSSTAVATTCQQLACKKCGNDMTPVQLHVVAYFSKHLQQQHDKVKDKKRVKPSYYGEALTKDEIITRIEEEEEMKQAKQKAKGKKRKRNNEQDAEPQTSSLPKKSKRKDDDTQGAGKSSSTKGRKKKTHEVNAVNYTQQQPKPKRTRKRKADESQGLEADKDNENTCQGCGGNYDDEAEDSQSAWIGCDHPGCWRWYHYWCAGYKRKPQKKAKFICTKCL